MLLLKVIPKKFDDGFDGTDDNDIVNESKQHYKGYGQ